MRRLLLAALLLAGCETPRPPPEERAFDERLTSSTQTPRFQNDALISRVVDGDTVVIRNAIWFGVTAEMSCRLVEVNAPEIVGADKVAGLAWKAKLEELLPTNSKVRVKSFALDKYGRPLVVIERAGVSINNALVEAMTTGAATEEVK